MTEYPEDRVRGMIKDILKTEVKDIFPLSDPGGTEFFPLSDTHEQVVSVTVSVDDCVRMGRTY